VRGNHHGGKWGHTGRKSFSDLNGRWGRKKKKGENWDGGEKGEDDTVLETAFNAIEKGLSVARGRKAGSLRKPQT